MEDEEIKDQEEIDERERTENKKDKMIEVNEEEINAWGELQKQGIW
jgi:hypothetical protein